MKNRKTLEPMPAWSLLSPLIFLQDTRGVMDPYHSRRQKLRCRRTAPVKQFTDYLQQMTSHGQFRRHLEAHLSRSHSVFRFFAVYRYIYLLTVLRTVGSALTSGRSRTARTDQRSPTTSPSSTVSGSRSAPSCDRESTFRRGLSGTERTLQLALSLRHNT